MIVGLSLILQVAALGDSLLGEAMGDALGLPRERARDVARRLLLASTTLKEGAKA